MNVYVNLSCFHFHPKKIDNADVIQLTGEHPTRGCYSLSLEKKSERLCRERVKHARLQQTFTSGDVERSAVHLYAGKTAMMPLQNCLYTRHRNFRTRLNPGTSMVPLNAADAAYHVTRFRGWM
jgi:hypothetical protein